MTVLSEIEIGVEDVVAWVSQPQILDDLKKVAAAAAAAIAAIEGGSLVTAASDAVLVAEAAADALEDEKFPPTQK
jgi:hypothetical protein